VKLIHWCIAIIVMTCIQMDGYAATPATQPAPSITLKPGVEDAMRVVLALVTLNGKPLKDLKVQLHVKRTFGLLPLGEDTTDDEGTAAVKFPEDLPGNERGELEVVATIVSAGPYSGFSTTEVVPGGVPATISTGPAFPRALWGARSPLPLYITIVVLIGAVWLTYARVVGHILAIRKGGRS
jgi:hypothetical protein